MSDYSFEDKIDKKQQFADILDGGIKIALTGSIMLSSLHYLSGAPGSPFERASYPFLLYLWCQIHKVIYTSPDNDGVFSRMIKPMFSNHCTLLFLMIFTIIITEGMIFDSKLTFAFSPT